MNEPVFLTIAQVKRLHQKSISRFGGTDGLRDTTLFESAVIQPRHLYHYGRGDLFDIAAAYAYHIAQAQACLDGNKRTDVAAALLFLELNGVSTEGDFMPLYDAMIAIAEKRAEKPQLAELLRRLCKA